MKRMLFILFLLAGSGPFARASGSDFEEAQAAYDSGSYSEAARLYQNMLSNGIDNVEVYYNLANADFKAGDLPQAVRYYRRAWYTAPRDPDIRANLHFALNAVGAIEPEYPFIQRMLLTFSSREWIWIAAGSYLVLALFILMAMLIRGARAAFLRLCLLPLAALLMALGGWLTWRGFGALPEGVIATTGITALYGPVEGSTAHYKLPAGALVRLTGTDSKGWVEVEYDGKKGWVNRGTILTLYP